MSNSPGPETPGLKMEAETRGMRVGEGDNPTASAIYVPKLSRQDNVITSMDNAGSFGFFLSNLDKMIHLLQFLQKIGSV